MLIAVLISASFFLLPLVGLFEKMVWGDVLENLTSPVALSALRVSAITSVAAALLSFLFGFPLAVVLARSNFRGRKLLRALVLLPLVLPPVVGGVALLSVFSRRVFLGRQLYEVFGIQLTFSIAGAILAATFVSLPFFVVTVESGIRNLGPEFEDVSTSLGLGNTETLFRVLLPLVRPSVVAGLILAWARALGEFGATITFAGNVEGRTQTLPLAVYLEIQSRPEIAIALSLVLVLLSMVVLATMRDHWLSR